MHTPNKRMGNFDTKVFCAICMNRYSELPSSNAYIRTVSMYRGRGIMWIQKQRTQGVNEYQKLGDIYFVGKTHMRMCSPRNVTSGGGWYNRTTYEILRIRMDGVRESWSSVYSTCFFSLCAHYLGLLSMERSIYSNYSPNPLSVLEGVTTFSMLIWQHK